MKDSLYSNIPEGFKEEHERINSEEIKKFNEELASHLKPLFDIAQTIVDDWKKRREILLELQDMGLDEDNLTPYAIKNIWRTEVCMKKISIMQEHINYLNEQIKKTGVYVMAKKLSPKKTTVS